MTIVVIERKDVYAVVYKINVVPGCYLCGHRNPIQIYAFSERESLR